MAGGVKNLMPISSYAITDALFVLPTTKSMFVLAGGPFDLLPKHVLDIKSKVGN